MRSKLFSIGIEDFLKGLLMAVLTPVVAVVLDSLNTGEFTLNYPLIATTALAGCIGYIKMRFLSNNSGQFLTNDKA